MRKTQLSDALDQNKGHNYVTALARGLELLRCFGDASEYLGNAQLAERTDIPRPTVSRLTATLTHLGYLLYVPQLEKYRLGPRVLDLGYRYLASEGVGNVATPFMQELADASDCMVALGAPEGAHLTYTHVCQGKGPLILRLQVGSRVPMALSSMGLAFLAAHDDAGREFHYERVRAESGGNWSEIEPLLEKAYADYDYYGFCMTESTWSRDISGVGVPLVLENGQRIVSFNCGGAAQRLSRQIMIDNLGPRLKQVVEQVRQLVVGGS
jgi:DNA-binding IclR family transcriptional regulator